MSNINSYSVISDNLKDKILTMYRDYMKEDSDKYSLAHTKDNYQEIDSLYCYEKDDEILGFINLFTPNQNEYYLYPFVHPDYRNTGIFKELLNHLVKELKKIPPKKTDGYQTPVFMLPLMKECKNFDEVSKIYEDLTKGEKETELLMSIYLTEDMYTPTRDVYITRTFPEENQIVSKIIKKENHTTVGYFATSLFEDKSACMTRVFVKPEYRRKGYATEGIGLMLNYLARKEYNNVILNVTGSNEKAIGLYGKLGFSVVSEEHFYIYQH